MTKLLALLLCLTACGSSFETGAADVPPPAADAADAAPSPMLDGALTDALTPPPDSAMLALDSSSYDGGVSTTPVDSGLADAHGDSPKDAPAEAETAPPPPTYCCIVAEFSSGHCEPQQVEMVGNWTCSDPTKTEDTCGIGAACTGYVDDCYGNVQYCP